MSKFIDNIMATRTGRRATTNFRFHNPITFTIESAPIPNEQEFTYRHDFVLEMVYRRTITCTEGDIDKALDLAKRMVARDMYADFSGLLDELGMALYNEDKELMRNILDKLMREVRI